MKSVSVGKLVGSGYGRFWRFRGRYRVVKGSRASKKSKTAALWFICNLMKYPGANLLVVRKTFCTLKNSCFTELKWAVNKLGAGALWEVRESPLEMIYVPTGQRIFFRGLDDPMKITSITVDIGALCWLWIEEAYELSSEDDFNMIDESIRGAVPEGLFKQVTITFNPWSENHWLKRRFFDVCGGGGISEDGNILAMTVDYRCNEWLDDSDRAIFERLRVSDPARYRVAALGLWGRAEGLVYENFSVENFDLEVLRAKPGIKSAFGLDFGYTNDPSALFCGLVDLDAKVIYVFDELYSPGLTNIRLFEQISKMGYSKEKIIADSASPKDIAELRELGLPRISAAKKGSGSVNFGIQFIRNFRIVISPLCRNFLAEISAYSWALDHSGRPLNVPVDSDNHLMDAMRYALESINRPRAFDRW